MPIALKLPLDRRLSKFELIQKFIALSAAFPSSPGEDHLPSLPLLVAFRSPYGRRGGGVGKLQIPNLKRGHAVAENPVKLHVPLLNSDSAKQNRFPLHRPSLRLCLPAETQREDSRTGRCWQYESGSRLASDAYIPYTRRAVSKRSEEALLGLGPRAAGVDQSRLM